MDLELLRLRIQVEKLSSDSLRMLCEQFALPLSCTSSEAISKLIERGKWGRGKMQEMINFLETIGFDSTVIDAMKFYNIVSQAPMATTTVSAFFNTRVGLRMEVVNGIANDWKTVAIQLCSLGYNTYVTTDFIQEIEVNYRSPRAQAEGFLDRVSGWAMPIATFAKALYAAGEQLLAKKINDQAGITLQPAFVSAVSTFVPVPVAPTPIVMQSTTQPLEKKVDVTSQLKKGLGLMVRLPAKSKIKSGQSMTLDVLFCDDIEEATEQCDEHLNDDIDSVGGEENRAPFIYLTARFEEAFTAKKRARKNTRVDMSTAK
jgi:hypothetical protein